MTHGGLFEGIGGFSLGARRAGVKTVWFSEMDNYKQNILKQHFPNTHLYGKIERIQDPPYVDIITGGFPCQDISLAGHKAGIFGSRSGLWTEYYRILTKTAPRYIIIENSPALNRSGMEYILHDLSRIGYDAEWTTLRADWFGHRHKRLRTFIAAHTVRQRSNKGAPCFFRSISEIFPQTEVPKQTYLPSLLKRFDGYTNPASFRANPGLSRELDRAAIHAIGDSVNVDIAHYLFECIKIHASHDIR